MKVRNGFISNSSTSSFVCVGYGFEEELKLEQIQKAFKLKDGLMWKCLVALNKKYKNANILFGNECYMGEKYKTFVGHKLTMVDSYITETKIYKDWVGSTLNTDTPFLRAVKEKLNPKNKLEVIVGIEET